MKEKKDKYLTPIWVSNKNTLNSTSKPIINSYREYHIDDISNILTKKHKTKNQDIYPIQIYKNYIPNQDKELNKGEIQHLPCSVSFPCMLGGNVEVWT